MHALKPMRVIRSQSRRFQMLVTIEINSPILRFIRSQRLGGLPRQP